MLALILLLVVFGFVLLIFTYLNLRNKPDDSEVTVQIDEECCGAHVVCERDTLLITDNKIKFHYCVLNILME
jgi:hypothetical protein